MPDIFEVGIFGAGVAGSICAQILREAGISLAPFDNSHPREKACGRLLDDKVVDEFSIPSARSSPLPILHALRDSKSNRTILHRLLAEGIAKKNIDSLIEADFKIKNGRN